MSGNPVLNARGDELLYGGDIDPTVDAVDAPKGSMYIFEGNSASPTPQIYQKNDDGLSTDWGIYTTGMATDFSNHVPSTVDIDLGANNLVNVADPTNLQDAATMNYVDGEINTHVHSAGDITSGTFADALVAQSNVTQHQGAIDHDVLTNYLSAEHINHSGVSVTGSDSITGGGAITASSSLSLVGDAAAPGNTMYYGTNGAGNKGYFTFPVGGANTTLSNLVIPTAINVHFNPDSTSNFRNLGDSGKIWGSLHVGTTSYYKTSGGIEFGNIINTVTINGTLSSGFRSADSKHFQISSAGGQVFIETRADFDTSLDINLTTQNVATRGEINLGSSTINLFDDKKVFMKADQPSSWWGGNIEGLFFDSVILGPGNNSGFVATTDVSTDQFSSDMYMFTGSQTQAATTKGSGELICLSGDVTSVTAVVGSGSGGAHFGSGDNLGLGRSGNLVLATGRASLAGGTGASGPVTIRTGSSGGGASGDISLLVGSSPGSQGNFKFLKTGVASVIGQVWTATGVDGSGYWAAAGGAGANTALSNLASTTSINSNLINAGLTSWTIATKGTTNTISNPLELKSGNASNSSSGNVSVSSGGVTGGNTGSVSLRTGTNSDTGVTGQVNIITGNAIDGNSGNILLQTGSASGNTRGAIRFEALYTVAPKAAAAPTGEAGAVYYDTVTNKLRCHNGTIWNDLF